MDNDSNQNELFTWVVKAGANRLYYINVKEDKNGSLYMVIKESKRRDDGSKEVHRVMVFEKDLQKFVDGLRTVLKFISERDTKPADSLSASQNHSSSDQEEPDFSNFQ